MRRALDRTAKRSMRLISALPGILVGAILVGLFLKSRAVLSLQPLTRLLFSSAWKPL